MSGTIDPDLEFGGRVFLEDGFSAVAQRVSQSFRTLRSGFEASAQRVRGVARGTTDAFRSAARAVQNQWYRIMHPRDDRGRYLLSPLTRLKRVADSATRSLVSLASAGGRALSGLGGSFGGFSFSIARIITGFRSLVGASFDAASQIENLSLSFTTLLGSAAAARAHIAELQSFAIGKPFEPRFRVSPAAEVHRDFFADLGASRGKFFALRSGSFSVPLTRRQSSPFPP